MATKICQKCTMHSKSHKDGCKGNNHQSCHIYQRELDKITFVNVPFAAAMKAYKENHTLNTFA